MIFPIKRLADLGFEVLATQGTAEVLRRNGIDARVVRKHFEGDRPGGEPTTVQLIARRRDRPDRQHPARHGAAAARPAPTATRSAPPPCWPTSRASPPCRGSARPCRASRRCGPARSGSGRCRTGRPVDGVRPAVPARASTRDRPRARAPRRLPGGPGRPGRCWSGCRRPGAAGRRRMGLTFPQPARARRRLRQERRRHRRAWPRWASATSRSAPSPASRSPATRSRGCSGSPPTARWSTGWASTTTAPRWSPGGWTQRRRARGDRPGPVLGVNIGKTKLVPDDDQARGRGRLPQERRAARAVRRLPGRQRLLAQHAGAAQPAVGRAARPAAGRRARRGRRVARVPTGRVPLLVKIAPDLADDDVLAVADLALELGLDGIIATNTTISRDGLASDPAEVERDRGRRALRPAAARPARPTVVRLLRDRVGPDLTLVGVGGITTADDAREPARGGRDPAAGLHRVRLRGPAAGRAGSSAACEEPDDHRPPRAHPAARHRRAARDPPDRRLPPPDGGRARHGRAVPPRHVRGRLDRRRAAGPPGLLDPPGEDHRRLRRHPGAGRRGARSRHRLAGRPAARHPVAGHRAARAAVRAARGAGAAACWSGRGTPRRRCSRSPSGCASATAR